MAWRLCPVSWGMKPFSCTLCKEATPYQIHCKGACHTQIRQLIAPMANTRTILTHASIWNCRPPGTMPRLDGSCSNSLDIKRIETWQVLFHLDILKSGTLFNCISCFLCYYHIILPNISAPLDLPMTCQFGASGALRPRSR